MAVVVLGIGLVLRDDDDRHPEVDLTVVPTAESMDALVTGRLLVEERCVVLQAGAAEPVLVLWPEGAEVVGAGATLAVRLPAGGEVPLDGERRDHGGGFVNEAPPGEVLPEHLAGIDALARCAARLDLASVFQMGFDPPS